ncbi:amidase [Anianabacter salinae]|uniref:amidase n=1 Tax=Anianabacter salinae TaxID=2851023 RepID=UPI00225E43C5|nr:amidase family protein [Anianabacter salinae]MBV0913379.1 amidase [Anianabacter salinae]
MATDWLWSTAGDLGRGIARGEIDPVALCETYLEAARSHARSPRIYARMTEDRALSEARAAAARAAAGQRRGSLDGVPVSWKDLFDTAGVATEAGSALLAGRVPARDAAVLRAATMAGLVCLGKTHMSELAFSGLGYNPVTETPPSVTDSEAVAGGSSSGAAASVAFGLAAAAVGSDTGGSVRVPAVWNDLVGLKTTSGRLSLEGVVPLCESFDTVGPLCRSVEDAALMLAALEGTAAPDLTGATLKGVRLLIVETVAMEGLRPEPAGGFARAVDALTAAGAVIERRELPFVADAHALSPTLFAPEAYATWETEIEAAPDKMFPEILNRFRTGRDTPARAFIQGWQALRRHRAAWAEATAGYDAVILPTAPNLPPKLDRLAEGGEYYVTENLMTLRNTRIGNLMGLAALTLPTGVPGTGIMLMTPPMTEHRLLRLGAAAEAALA